MHTASGQAPAAGLAVAQHAVAVAAAELGEDLDAAYLLGSLAHGGFAAGVSDVDVALVVRRTDDPTRDRISRARDRAVSTCPDPLAQRLSVFWSSWSDLRGDAPGGRFPPLDRHDLLHHGRLLRGTDRRVGVPEPSRDALRAQNREDALDRLASGPPDLRGASLRTVTKAVLNPVRAMYTHVHGFPAGNDEAVEWYRRAPAVGSRTLVEAAYRLRVGAGGPDEVEAVARHDVEPLYDELRRTIAVAPRGHATEA